MPSSSHPMFLTLIYLSLLFLSLTFSSILPPSLPLSTSLLIFLTLLLFLNPHSFFLLSPSPPAGSDYSSLMNYQFTMTQGQIFALISIPIINDTDLEPMESSLASLSLVSHNTTRITVAPNEASITIEDDDRDREFQGESYMYVRIKVTRCYF